MTLSHRKPLECVFFDIGGTLGQVNKQLELTLFPDTLRVLETFASLGLRIGVITNVPVEVGKAEVAALLELAGLGDFFSANAIVTSTDAHCSKPDPRIYKFAADRLGVAPRDCLFIGEDSAEVAGAESAGMRGIVKPKPA